MSPEMNAQVKTIYCLMLNCEGEIIEQQKEQDGSYRIFIKRIIVSLHDKTRHVCKSWVRLTPDI